MELCKLIFVFVISIVNIANAENGANFLISRGFPAKEGQFPFQGISKLKNTIGCSTIVLNENYALTAAHCIHKRKPKHLTLYFGILNVRDTKNATKRNVIEIIEHENYDNNTADNDIALLKLDKPLQFSKVIEPVKLPSPEEDFTGQLVTVSGWGETESSLKSEELLYVYQRIVDRKICEEQLIKADAFTEGMDCVTTHDGERRSACKGDSGGPIVLKDTSTLVGIVSYGLPGFKCGDPYNYNVRVSHYIDWIKVHT